MASSFATAATGWFNDFLTIKVNGVGTANNYYIGSDPSTGATALQGKAFGVVSALEIIACDMSYWSDSQDRTGGSFFYNIKSADGTTQVVAPVETVWDQSKLAATNDYQGTKTFSLNLLSGLPAGTYQLHVWAKSWGSDQGDSWLSNNSADYVATFTVNTPVSITGANGIADNAQFINLKAAFDAINLQADQAGKDIEIKINGSTTELATAALNQGNWNSLTIYPTVAGATIGGDFIGTLIDLNGADNVTINGKLNKTGVAKSLTISQSEATDNSSRTIRLTNDAKSNTIQYVTIQGKCPSTGAGVIFFSTTSGTDGNDGNIIEYCDINAMGAAAVGVGSAGTAAKENSGNIIRYNNIYDFYLGNTSSNSTYGISIGANNTDWEITGNSLYQTASRAYGTTATFHYGIYISTTGNNFIIKDNYIGGSTTNASGTPWTITGGLGRPVGLYTSVGTTTASSIQNNTIANYDITTDYVTNVQPAFAGYWLAAGSVNVGTVTGNTIGSTTSTGSIVVKYNAAAVGALTVGINIVTAANVSQIFSNNKIGGIIADYLNTANRGHLYVVNTSGAGAITFTNNIIGSTTIANSIEHKGSTYTGGQTNIRGLNMNHAAGSTITGNIIANITSSSTGTTTTNGIFHASNGVTNISNNVVRDIKSYGTKVITTQGIDASLIGILNNCNSAGNVMNGNTIYNLENTNNTLATDVYGINFHSLNAGASTIDGNKIYNLLTASTNTAANIMGISITRGLTTTTNNMITLGSGITNAVAIAGIRKLGTAATQNNNFYHNTVVIEGSEIGTAGSSYTAAFAKVYSATDVVKNNIFINNRSNATGNTQKHYTVYLNELTTFTSDYNVVNFTGTGGLLGAVGTTDYATGQAWVTGTGLDTNSKVRAVNFTAPATCDLTLTGASVGDVYLRVPSLAAVTTDFTGKTRNTSFTYAGAHESDLPFITTGLKSSTLHTTIIGTATGIRIELDTPSTIELYTSNGMLVEKTFATGTYSRALNKGVYVVLINGKSTKFVK